MTEINYKDIATFLSQLRHHNGIRVILKMLINTKMLINKIGAQLKI